MRRATYQLDPEPVVVRRTILKGKSLRSQPYASIKGTALYKDAGWSGDQRSRIVEMHDSDETFTAAEVRSYLALTPLPSIDDIEDDKQTKAAATPAKAKRNATAKDKQKRKSKMVKGWNPKKPLHFTFKSKVGGHHKRTVVKKDVTRGNRMIKFGQTALANMLKSKNPNTIQAVMAHINQMKANNALRLAGKIGGSHLTTNVSNMNVAPTEAPGLLAMTHVSLTGTDQRSDYSAFVRPEAGQAHGALHPLQAPSSNPSFALLNAVEALRNDGQFIISMLLKNEAIAAGKMSIKHAVNPTKFGAQEIKEVAGQERSHFAPIVSANTAYAVDFITKAGGSGLAKLLDQVLEQEDLNQDTSVMEGQLIALIEKNLLALTTAV